MHTPGNAAGLFFDDGILEKRYITHNIYSHGQTSICLAVMTRYLSSMEAWID